MTAIQITSPEEHKPSLFLDRGKAIKSDEKVETLMPSIKQSVPVTFDYDVHFTTGLFKPENHLLARVIANNSKTPKKVLVVIDQGLLCQWPTIVEDITVYAENYNQQITLVKKPMTVAGGEESKNDPIWVEYIHQAIDEVGLCRHSYVLGIGGGAVLDMIGYAAATAHRGVRLIRVPTTVLGQNDSGVGVKNGINAFGKKNFLGTFAPPYAVINDFDFLTSLEDRDWRAGIAEAVKVALIKDPDFFNFINQNAKKLANRSMSAMQELVYRCAKLHLNHIANSGDPFEKGSSRPLDFGHWSAHKLEQLTNYRLRHGEAVAIGIALDSIYSYLKGWLSEIECQRIVQTLQDLGFALYVPELTEYIDVPKHPKSIFKGLTEFQEHLGGELTIMLLQGIGEGVEVHQVDLSLYKQAIVLLQEKQLAEFDPSLKCS
ncbi:MAG: 3-dehydroquinate synthase [Microcoleaceae cyanobacterium MO_207.B10]|nr:3-dehydroquinate synthase [Microcoleaceae cyanobacterium MO_207.B10]